MKHHIEVEGLESFNVDGDSMKEMGIKIITGEACAYSMRLRCELNEYAMQLYLEYTGIQTAFENIRKSPYHGEEYTAFLTWEQMEDLLIFHLMRNFSHVTEIIPNTEYLKDMGFRGQKFLLAGENEDIKKYIDDHPHMFTKETYDDINNKWNREEGLYNRGRSYWTGSGPRRGSSNIHMFTGIAI